MYIQLKSIRYYRKIYKKKSVSNALLILPSPYSVLFNTHVYMCVLDTVVYGICYKKTFSNPLR